MFEQTTRLVKRGHRIHLITRKRPDHPSHHQIICGVSEHRYRVVPFLSSLPSFDAALFHQPLSGLTALSSPYLPKQIPKIYVCHSLWHEEFISRNSPKIHPLTCRLQAWLRKQIEAYVLSQSQSIIVLSEFTQKKLQDIHGIAPARVSILSGGVDLERFYPAGDQQGIRRRLNLPEHRLILLTVRNLVPRMGLENLIAGFRHVVRREPHTLLVIGGSGPLAGQLKARIRQYEMDADVRLIGFIPEPDLPDYYRAADLFVLPTIELEGFGLVTLEAMACGTPVIGTPVGGTSEILGRWDPGFLFQDTQPESLAELMIKTCRIIKENPVYWKDVSQKCRQFVEAYYSWDHHINRLEDLLGTHVRHLRKNSRSCR